MKKTLALVLAFALVFSTMTMAFADDAAAISADGKICADLGMLKGATGTVDAAYLATTPNRLQAAVMFLRLKGLEKEANDFSGADNFADANSVNWGKPVMAYLKAHPELGWIGDGKNLNPNGKMTAKDYYKVMLEALGYKQNTSTVVGDFTYENVLDFAAKQGLAKAATAATFTVNDLAVATVEALKANVKEGKTTLIDTLVAAGKLDKETVAKAFGATAPAGKVALVKAVSNSAVLIEFTENVDKTYAENTANFKIEGLEIKSGALEGTKGVVLTTADMTAGKSYTVEIGSDKMSFTAIAKDSAAPAIDEVEGTDTNKVTVTFTKRMDTTTALDMANYKIDGATIKSAAWDDNEKRDAVVLMADSLTNGKSYRLTVSNVKSADLVALKSESKAFTAKTDKSAPKINEDDTECNTNTRMTVAFTDDNEITKESAENLANWKITVGSGSDTLEVKAAKLVENDDNDMLKVELTTASQKSGQKYVIHASNIVDTSVLANKLKEDTVDVHGKKVDKDAPKVDSVDYAGEDSIKVTYKDDSRMDLDSIVNVSNYTISNDVKIDSVKLVDADDSDCKSVIIKVSGLDDGKTYKVTANNVADEYGNKIEKDNNKSKKYDEKKASTKVTINKVVVTNDTEIKVYFTDDVAEKSAEVEANYSISGGVGAPKDAVRSEKSGEHHIVTLTTSKMDQNKQYSVTVNGVEDEAGRVITDTTGKFYVSADTADFDAPEIEEVECVNDHLVRVTFDQPIWGNGSMKLFINVDGDPATTEIYGVRAIYGSDDLTVQDFKLQDAAGKAYVIPDSLDGKEVTITKCTAEDYSGNLCDDDDYKFDLSSEDPDEVEVTSWEQVSPKEFKVEFSEYVTMFDNDVKGDAYSYDGDADITTISNKSGVSPYTLTVKCDKDYDNIYHLYSNVKMDDDKDFKIRFSQFMQNYEGVAVTDTDRDSSSSETYTAMDTNIDDTEEPYVSEVNVIDRSEIDITFNEQIATLGSYKLHYIDKDGKDAYVGTSVEMDKNDNEIGDHIVKLHLDKNLEARYSYDIIPQTKVKDVAGNEADWTLKDNSKEIATVDGTDTAPIDNYITGVRVYSGSVVQLKSNDKMRAFNIDSAYMWYALNSSTVIGNSDAAVYPNDDYAKIGATPKDVVDVVYGSYQIPYEMYKTLNINDYSDDKYTYNMRVIAETNTTTLKDAKGKDVTYYIPKFAFVKDTNYTFTMLGMTKVFEGVTDHDVDVTAIAGGYKVQYDDMETGDVVAFLDAGGNIVASDVVDENVGGELTYNKADIVNIIVVRDADNSVRYNAPVIEYVPGFNLAKDIK